MSVVSSSWHWKCSIGRCCTAASASRPFQVNCFQVRSFAFFRCAFLLYLLHKYFLLLNFWHWINIIEAWQGSVLPLHCVCEVWHHQLWQGTFLKKKCFITGSSAETPISSTGAKNWSITKYCKPVDENLYKIIVKVWAFVWNQQWIFFPSFFPSFLTTVILVKTASFAGNSGPVSYRSLCSHTAEAARGVFYHKDRSCERRDASSPPTSSKPLCVGAA